MRASFLSRRCVIGTLAGGIASAFAFGRPLAATGDARIRLHNIHTGESVDRVYRTPAGYDSEALAEINKALRDFRTGDVYPMAPGVLDLVHDLGADLGISGPFEIISGYRSPQTNAKLHAASAGVASHSLHMKGMAIDLAAPGRSLRDVHAAALAMKRGGVGLYERSGFVHVDIGRVRSW